MHNLPKLKPQDNDSSSSSEDDESYSNEDDDNHKICSGTNQKVMNWKRKHSSRGSFCCSCCMAANVNSCFFISSKPLMHSTGSMCIVRIM